MNIAEKTNEVYKKIGKTPVVEIDGIFCKIEGYNPAGSVKDRAAYFIIKSALDSGALKEGGTVVEATSGNTGIGLSYIAREAGLRALIVMPESMSEERRRMLKSYGAELYLTPASEGMDGAVKEAKRIAAETGAYFADQFNNHAGIEAHFCTTAPELFGAVPNTEYVVAGIGSGGTAMGIKKYIEQGGLSCKVIGVEPASSPLLSKGYAAAHRIQGIGANFVPSILDKDKLDGIIAVSDDDAIAAVREIYRKSGVKCGISSGAAFVAARQLYIGTRARIAAIFPDNGERYASALYE